MTRMFGFPFGMTFLPGPATLPGWRQLKAMPLVPDIPVTPGPGEKTPSYFGER